MQELKQRQADLLQQAVAGVDGGGGNPHLRPLPHVFGSAEYLQDSHAGLGLSSRPAGAGGSGDIGGGVPVTSAAGPPHLYQWITYSTYFACCVTHMMIFESTSVLQHVKQSPQADQMFLSGTPACSVCLHVPPVLIVEVQTVWRRTGRQRGQRAGRHGRLPH